MSDKKKVLVLDAVDAQLIDVDDFEELPTQPYAQRMRKDRHAEGSGDLGLAMLAADDTRPDGAS